MLKTKQHGLLRYVEQKILGIQVDTEKEQALEIQLEHSLDTGVL